MAKNPSKADAADTTQADAADTPQAPAANTAKGQTTERTYPWTGRAVNNTPIPIYLSEAGVSLAANYHAPANEAEVTYQSADHFAREMANVHAIESVHGFDEALILSDLDAE